MIIGRNEEIFLLKSMLDSAKSEFVAVYGRRRVGKTFLIREALDYKFAFEHTGLKNTISDDSGAEKPIKDLLKKQLKEFSISLRKYGWSGRKVPADWYEAFHLLEGELEKQPKGRKVIFLDECPWMDTPRSDFLGALDHFWNGWCTMRRDIVLIICGSAASWVLNKIESDVGGLHNRITRHVYLRPFRLAECEQLMKAKGVVMNRDQILEGYMIFGGIPFYWDLLRSDLSFAQNVDALLFSPNGELSREYNFLYRSLFRKPEPYIAIVQALAEKRCGLSREEIAKVTGLASNGDLSEMLEALVQCDFVRVYGVPGKVKRDRLFQLMDNFTLFYFRFINGRSGIAGNFWSANEQKQAVRIWCGLAFERVALQHVDQIKRKLGIGGVITREYGWRFVSDEEDAVGAQIDLVIERDDRVTNLCEMKYTAEPFEISDDYDRRLKTKREVYLRETGTNDAVHLTLVSAHGAKHNANWRDLQSEIVLDDLFQ